MEIRIEDIELMYSPLTKQLLQNYVLAQYEENADISDKSLKKELVMLHDNNALDQLFIGEYLLSEERLTSVH